ncbi:hypothetical protein [Candidatus Vampirococcus lugosii]|uniref:YARHG domain-containing protein n=1 Tax=Candidatus Vampirococcus lugosii TaxID=2789015 RepID=A0ABS5QNE6_9BACT|nr:hypothetical protein [Candidatus Vampirococcus lugosii]MBS8121969.1 hypothetical protein [Candidatus Vampirococcus lugosii]
MSNIKYLIIPLFFLIPIVTYGTQDMREECYNDLTNYMSKVEQFKPAYEMIQDLGYDKLSESFSKKYENMSSFGVDLNKPILSMRLHSFGEQTSYQHPPYSPFPIYEGTEKWENPVKEFIIAEEFVTNPEDGQEYFIGCSFMNIQSPDLMSVDADNYWYDGEILSVLVEDKSKNNKVWHNTNRSFNYENEILADFDRLFVFPKLTQNDFFSKYDIIDAFPTNKIDLKKYLNVINPSGDEELLFTVVYDQNGNVIGGSSLDVFKGIFDESNNEGFPLFDMYQEIENLYPEFAKYLAINGFVSFDVFKELMNLKGDHSYADLWSFISRSKDLIKYANQIRKGEEPDISNDTILVEFYDEMLKNIDSFDKDARERIGLEPLEISNSELNEKNIKNIKNTENDDGDGFNYYIIIAILGFVFFIIFLFIILGSKNKK